MYTAGSLFTGVGGADKGLEMAGFKTVWGIERDEKIAEYAQLNFPDANIINSCVSEVKPHKLKHVDLLWMSPPCQDYSAARRGDLAPHPDKDAGLYCESFIAAIDPRWVVLENVPAYANSPVFEKILARLIHHGYRYHWLILNAADYGVPQDRKRLIMWAARRGEKLPFFPPSKRRVGWYEAIAHLIPSLPDTKLAEWQIKRLEEIGEKLSGMDLIDIGKNTGRPATIKAENKQSFTITSGHTNASSPIIVGSNKSDYPILMPRVGANIHNCLPSFSHEPCPTIRAFKEGRHTHWADVVGEGIVKQVTPEASALLQSFPTEFIFPPIKTLAQRMIGNAVPPLLARELGLAIVKTA